MNTQNTARALREYEYEFAMELKQYVEHLREQYKEAPENARKEAKIALMRTGVIKGGV